jgi:hypothetical protein
MAAMSAARGHRLRLLGVLLTAVVHAQAPLEQAPVAISTSVGIQP